LSQTYKTSRHAMVCATASMQRRSQSSNRRRFPYRVKAQATRGTDETPANLFGRRTWRPRLWRSHLGDSASEQRVSLGQVRTPAFWRSWTSGCATECSTLHARASAHALTRMRSPGPCGAGASFVAKRSRRPTPAHERSPSMAIVPWRLLRRPALGDCELVGKAGCASSLESESIFGKRSRMSEGLPLRCLLARAGSANARRRRLLQSPRSGSLVRAGSQAAEIAQK
jgi:hypothetical protein